MGSGYTNLLWHHVHVGSSRRNVFTFTFYTRLFERETEIELFSREKNIVIFSDYFVDVILNELHLSVQGPPCTKHFTSNDKVVAFLFLFWRKKTRSVDETNENVCSDTRKYVLNKTDVLFVGETFITIKRKTFLPGTIKSKYSRVLNTPFVRSVKKKLWNEENINRKAFRRKITTNVR